MQVVFVGHRRSFEIMIFNLVLNYIVIMKCKFGSYFDIFYSQIIYACLFVWKPSKFNCIRVVPLSQKPMLVNKTNIHIVVGFIKFKK
jgi:hypothetical protein